MTKRQAYCLVCMGGGKALGRPGTQRQADLEATSHLNAYGHNVTTIEAR